MKSYSKGFSTRYDFDLGGNHIQKLKEIENRNYLTLVHDCKTRFCTICKLKKEVKGATNKNHKFVCKQCNDLRSSV